MPLNIDFQQIFLHMLNFVILFAVLYFLLYKPIKKFIDDREAEYKKDADEAAEKLKKADDALAGLDKALAEKEKEAEEQRTALLDDAREQYDKKLAAAEADAKKLISDAREQADAIREKAAAQLGDDISRLALESVKKTVLSTDEAFDAFLSAVEEETGDE